MTPTPSPMASFRWIVFVVALFLLTGPASARLRAELVETVWQQPPTYTFTYAVVCRNTGGALPITLSGVPSGGTYTASSPLLPISQANGAIFANNNTPPGNYTVTYTGGGATAVVTIPPAGTASISTPNSSICQGQSVLLSSQLIGAGLTAVAYSWSPGSSSSFAYQVSPNVSTTYSVTITDNFGCVHRATRVVLVSPQPSNLSINSPTRVCAGQPAPLSVSGSFPQGTVFQWMPGNYFGQNVNPIVTTTTNFQLNVNAPGCPSQTLSVQVNVEANPTPTVTFNYFPIICTDGNDELPLLDTGFTQGGTFFSDDPAFPVDPQTGKVRVSQLQAGSYFVSYSLTAEGCRPITVSEPVLLLVGQSTRMDIGPNKQIVEGEGVVITASGAASYSWEPSEGLNCTECPSPYAAPLSSTRYCVSDPENGCNQGGCINVEVVCVNKGDMSVPSAFTPNGDGRNDLFCLKGYTYCVTSFQIRIFNRWGQQVYASTQNDFCWDGNFNGEALPAGVYVYSIEATLNREKFIKNGNITIIR